MQVFPVVIPLELQFDMRAIPHFYDNSLNGNLRGEFIDCLELRCFEFLTVYNNPPEKRIIEERLFDTGFLVLQFAGFPNADTHKGRACFAERVYREVSEAITDLLEYYRSEDLLDCYDNE